MDSKAIAKRLEQEYPTPTLNLDSSHLPTIERLVPKIMATLRGVWMSPLYNRILTDQSKDHFLQVSERKYGKPLKQVMEEGGGEEAWIEALPSIHALGEILREEEGPFVMGHSRKFHELKG